MKLLKLFLLLSAIFCFNSAKSQTIFWQPQGNFEMQNIRSLGAFGLPVKDTLFSIGFTNRDSVGCLRLRPLDGLIYVRQRWGWMALAPVSLVNTKVNILDTSSMLLPYLRKLDTASLSSRINLRVRYIDTSAMLLPYLHKSDTTSMLLPYLRKSDTSSISNRINLKVNISDTATMLSKYLRKSDTTAMLSVYLRKGDTASMLSPYLRKLDTLSLSNHINTKVNISDTANMLLPYLRKNDTTSMLTNYLRTGSNGLTVTGHNIALGGTLTGTTNIEIGANTFSFGRASGIAGTFKLTPLTSNLATSFNGSDLTRVQVWTDGVSTGGIKVFDFYAKGITYEGDYSAAGKLDPRWLPDIAAVRSTIRDTSALKVYYTDTTSMLSPYLRKGDTTSLSNRINTKEPTITAGTTAQYWRGDKTFQTLQISAVANGTLQGVTANSTIDSTNRIMKITGSTGSLTGTGGGLEMFWSGTSSILQSYNRLTSTSQPITITGSTITLTGGIYASTRNVTVSASATNSDFIITVNNPAIATITLPAAASSNNQILIIKKLSGAALNVTIQANAAELIDGTNTKSLTLQYSSVMLHCDGTKWNILAANSTSLTL